MYVRARYGVIILQTPSHWLGERFAASLRVIKTMKKEEREKEVRSLARSVFGVCSANQNSLMSTDERRNSGWLALHAAATGFNIA